MVDVLLNILVTGIVYLAISLPLACLLGRVIKRNGE